jgi:pimeloyl-ACP methyl ester carboxylesterase/DNA-binding CsgD family transcriptional regulator
MTERVPTASEEVRACARMVMRAILLHARKKSQTPGRGEAGFSMNPVAPAGEGARSSAQDVSFCTSADGVRIAYATHGTGPPLVVAACWLSHLQFDWESPVWRHFLDDLGRFATIIRYDERGHGLSDRDVYDHSLELRVADLEAVVAHAGVDRFALMGMAQGGPVVIEYAVRHPERVTRLLFYGSYAAGLPDPSPEDLAMSDAFSQMIKVGWARPGSEFRRVFTSMMIPDATEEQMTWLDELQRVSVDADVAVTARNQRKREDARELLPLIEAPTLVLHARGDRMNPFADGRGLATGIAGARLVPLESENHILLADEPAWRLFVDEVEGFLADDLPEPAEVGADLPDLSQRELDVLRLVAEGRENDDIAAELHISPRTVERHLQNVYAKLGVTGRSARAAAVARLLRA